MPETLRVNLYVDHCLPQPNKASMGPSHEWKGEAPTIKGEQDVKMFSHKPLLPQNTPLPIEGSAAVWQHLGR